MDKILFELNTLISARDKLKNFNRDYNLQQKALFDNSEQIFKPLIDEQKITNEKLVDIVNSKNNLLALPTSTPQPTDEKIKTVKTNGDELPKTWKLIQNQNNEFKINNKLIDISDNEIGLKNSNTRYPFNESMKKLLTGDILENHSFEDIVNYFNLTNESGSNRQADRYTQLETYLRKNIVPKNGSEIITISSNPNDLQKRLNILLSAKKEGHNSGGEEISAILDKLLDLKKITIKDYKKLL